MIFWNVMRMKLICLLFCFLCVSYSSFSQSFEADTISINDQVKQSVQLYDHFIGAEGNLYNGRDYISYDFKEEGIPFFLSDTLSRGWISYQGRLYMQIPLQYDIVRNQVVIINYNRRYKIVLQNDLIDSFHLLNHTFLRLKINPEQNLDNTTFYDLLYNGHIRILAIREKRINEIIKEGEIVQVFYKQERFYVYKMDNYYLVNSRKDIFRLFNEKKHQIKSMMRRQKIKFRRNNFEKALVVAATIYDQH